MQPTNTVVLQSVFLVSIAILAYQTYQGAPYSLLNYIPHKLHVLPFFRMSGIKQGDSFPDGVVFTWVFPFHPDACTKKMLISSLRYVPYTEEKADIKACGMPQKYNASKEWAGKKVVLISVPGKISQDGCFTHCGR